jgi:hypothetical protein
MIRDSELLFPRPTAEEVLSNLTDFFYTEALQAEAEKELQQRKKVVTLLKQKAGKGDISIGDVAAVLQSSPQALNALISLVGISQERFLGIMTLKTVGEKKSGEPMSMNGVRSGIQRDREFALDVSALLLHGKQDKELIDRVPPFDLAKLDKPKFMLKVDDLVDSLLRLGLKGRYDAKKGDILEDHIEEILRATGVQYIRGETRVAGLSRDLDFIVPNANAPYILIESGVFETTARELSDKARVEAFGLEEIERRYPKARFVRVTDGVGWKRRGGQDLSNLIQASHYFLVFKTLRLLEKIVRYHVPKEFFGKR